MTAVEFLVEELIKLGYLHSKEYSNSPKVLEVIEQAKEMEKQQILDAFEEGSSDGYDGWGSTNKEKYYNETYKK